jgi:hypothetical protein
VSQLWRFCGLRSEYQESHSERFRITTEYDVPSLAFAFSIPVLAATLAFVTYTLTAHKFDVAVIFASLNLFQVSNVT